IPMMAYNTNMDSMSSLKYTTGSAMQQLVDAVRAAINNPTEKPSTAEENETTEDTSSEKPSKEKLPKEDIIMEFLFDCKEILLYYNKKINEKTKFEDLQPGSDLFNLIQNDD
ncbi:358_t:CDS:2, partial [Cetraspora pellucida]